MFYAPDVRLIGAVADEEVIRILKQGTAAWNEQRTLGKANLVKADLTGADLSGAHLSGANLSEAYLTGADLSRADLGWADLTEADLSGANLIQAYLSRADLSGANLSGADVSHSIVKGTIFADLDLTTVQGLKTVKHNGPSTISVDTIYKSKGQIPEIFLRGAGVPEP
jgi:uncharacterized protein YjbI with pentapeptide repeats